jgi:hypothetical protein
MNIINEKFVLKFAEIKDKLGINNKIIAIDLKFTQSTISIYSTGKRLPSSLFINKFCKKYKIDPELFDIRVTKEEYISLLRENEKYKLVKHGKQMIMNIQTSYISQYTMSNLATIAKLKNKKTMGLINDILQNYINDYIIEME